MRFVFVLLNLMMTAAVAVAGDSEAITPDDRLVGMLLEQTEGLRPAVVQMALAAYRDAAAEGHAAVPLLTIIDYELPSYQKRLWVIDLEKRSVLFEEWVAHGMGSPRGSGGDMEMARTFSNEHGTKKSSLGLFRTAETYHGKHGYSLKLDGLEPDINHRARERAIVMHGAHYVSADRADDRLVGRSWGCPAVRPAVSRELIDAIKGGSLLWVYYPDSEWLERSSFLERVLAGFHGMAGNIESPPELNSED